MYKQKNDVNVFNLSGLLVILNDENVLYSTFFF